MQFGTRSERQKIGADAALAVLRFRAREQRVSLMPCLFELSAQLLVFAAQLVDLSFSGLKIVHVIFRINEFEIDRLSKNPEYFKGPQHHGCTPGTSANTNDIILS